MCGLLYDAVDPAGELDFLGTSDATLSRKLRATAHFAPSQPAASDVVTVERLAALDEAHDYAAASSYRYLNAELSKLRGIVLAGGVVRVEGADPPVVLATAAQFDAWVRARYPHATIA